MGVEERPTDAGRRLAAELDVERIESPDDATWRALLARVGSAIPSPGVPDHHPLFRLARPAGVSILSEFDLAQRWDRRPLVAIPGTNGQTPVTELTRAMLDAPGLRAAPVGNTEVPPENGGAACGDRGGSDG